MNYIILFIIILGMILQSIIRKEFDIKNKGAYNILVFNVILSATSLFMLLCLCKFRLQFHVPTLIYSLVFAVSFSITMICSFKALEYGLLSLTSLVIAYSLAIPTIFGIVVLRESIKSTVVIGIILLAFSLFFINKKGGENKITLKWAVMAFLSFLGNGTASAVLKMHQVNYPGLYRLDFMVFGMAVVTIISVLTCINIKPADFISEVKKNYIYAISAGAASGAVNYAVIILSSKMTASVMFPLISAGNIVLTYFVSVLWYKEKLSRIQILGFLMGTISVIALNL